MYTGEYGEGADEQRSKGVPPSENVTLPTPDQGKDHIIVYSGSNFN